MVKFPLRLPLCPHCGARFFYKQVVKAKKQDNMVCKHCKKQFQISYKKGTALLIALAILILIIFNILLLAYFSFTNVIGLFLVAIIGISITYFLIPYTVRFKK